jgi:hypothetical protein
MQTVSESRKASIDVRSIPRINRMDAAGVCVKVGHTVHYGASVGCVLTVKRGNAQVRWISGVMSWHSCHLLTVARGVGRMKLVAH